MLEVVGNEVVEKEVVTKEPEQGRAVRREIPAQRMEQTEGMPRVVTPQATDPVQT